MAVILCTYTPMTVEPSKHCWLCFLTSNWLSHQFYWLFQLYGSSGGKLQYDKKHQVFLLKSWEEAVKGLKGRRSPHWLLLTAFRETTCIHNALRDHSIQYGHYLMGLLTTGLDPQPLSLACLTELGHTNIDFSHTGNYMGSVCNGEFKFSCDRYLS